MKIAIVGSSGYIAGFLLKRLKNEKMVESVLEIDQTQETACQMNLLKAEEFDYSVLNDIDYVIFTAAVSGPDQCASDFELCWNINVVGTGYFIEQAIERNCRVLFFSSDAVFGDVPGYIYDENSETCAVTPYGRMKKTIEDEFKGNSGFKAIRLSYVASIKDRFVSYCLNCIKEGKEAEVFHPFYRNCISITDVVDVVDWLIHHWDEYNPDVLNVAGKELVSRVRIADELNRNLGGTLHYSISMPNEEFYKNRPEITQMRSLYLQKYHIIEDNTFTEKMKKELEDIRL